MRKILFKAFTGIQHVCLRRKGYVLGKNVVVSRKGVRKIGGVKLSALTM